MLATPTLAAHAQLGGVVQATPLGQIGSGVNDSAANVGSALTPLTQMLDDNLGAPVRKALDNARDLARQRLHRLSRFVAEHRSTIAWDDNHDPAVRGEVLVLSPDAPALSKARKAGYAVIESGTIGGLGVAYARLAPPRGVSLAKAVRTLRKVLPDNDVSADQIHFPARSATRGVPAGGHQRIPAQSALPRGGTVGIIDGGLGASPAASWSRAAARIAAQRLFAKGPSRTSDHAAAIASLLAGAGTARIFDADVYGSDPAGGNALAIARALGWMHDQGVDVVSISLVGPSNPLLAKAVAAARARGMTVVAAVGNDGAAAPLSYPASYPGVIAVTGVDGSGRVLIEAGRASHVDYGAPGADMSALVPGRGRIDVRGTSYAAPLVASRIAARMAGDSQSAMARVASEAVPGPPRSGRGILCDICRSGL